MYIRVAVVLVLIALAVLCASALGQTTAEDWFLKAQALYAESYGRHDGNPEAMKAFDEAFRLDPNNAVMWFNYGTFLKSYYEFDDALKAFDEAIRLDPNNASAWDLKGWVLMNQGTHVTKSYSYTVVDMSTYDQGKLNEALAAFDEAIRLNPKYVDAYYQRYHVLYYLGRDAEADAASKAAYAIEKQGNTG